MKELENRCVSCGLPCLGEQCCMRNVVVYTCDQCGEETQLYDFDGQELCIDCIEERLTKINEYI